MLEIIEKMVIYIINNLENNPEEIKRVNNAIQATNEVFGYPICISFVSRDVYKNELIISYTDCNGFTEYISWSDFKKHLPNFVWFEEDAILFIKEYINNKKDE